MKHHYYPKREVIEEELKEYSLLASTLKRYPCNLDNINKNCSHKNCHGFCGISGPDNTEGIYSSEWLTEEMKEGLGKICHRLCDILVMYSHANPHSNPHAGCRDRKIYETSKKTLDVIFETLSTKLDLNK